MEENKINEMETRELSVEESEKVAGGARIKLRPGRKTKATNKENNNTDATKSDDGSVSGSGEW